MTFSPINPENYRAFAMGKLVRDGILLDAIQRGGVVFAHRIDASCRRARLNILVRKIIEELSEVRLARRETKARLLEEIADFHEILSISATFFPLLSNVKPTPMSESKQHRIHAENQHTQGKKGRGRSNLRPVHAEDIYAGWNDLSKQTFRGSSVKQKLLVTFTRLRHDTLNYLQHEYMRVTPEMIEQAIANKRRQKGLHTGWYADVIVLPFSDKWCAYFAEHFPEISPVSLNPAQAITHEILRHPQR